MEAVRVAGLLLVALVVGSVAGYGVAQARLGPELEAARGEAARLGEELDAARGRVAELEAVVDDLEARLAERERLVEDLNETVRVLEEERARLEAALNEIMAERVALEARVANLTATVEELSGLVANLSGQVEALEALLDGYESTLAEALEWYGLGPGGVVFTDHILEAAPGTVENTAWLVLSGLDSTGDRVAAVFDYIMWSTMYFNDSYLRIPLPGEDGVEVVVWDQHIMLPNETLEAGGGDCDDLALLAYALLQAYPAAGERVYIIEWTQAQGPGHAAVLVVSPEGYYIVDPAGNWLNWIQAYLELAVENYADRSQWLIYIPPLSLDPDYKAWLIQSRYAVPNYYDPLDDIDYYWEPPPIEAYTNPLDLLYDWIIIYWGTTELEQIGIHAPGTHVHFTNIQDAATWIQENA